MKIPLSSKEFEVLAYLATHAGKALSPDTINADVWRNQFGDITAVAVYVQRLRRKIEKDPDALVWAILSRDVALLRKESASLLGRPDIEPSEQ